MILRIEESRLPGDAPPRTSVLQVGGPRERKTKDKHLARTNLAAIEMAVVLIVVALVMVAIILTSGCSNRQPHDLSAAYPSLRMPQLQKVPAAQVDSQKVNAQSAPAGLSGSAGATPAEQRLEDAKRNARESEVSDLSVGS